MELPLIEVETRGGAPDEAPPPGEERRAPGVGGGEERDDVLAQRVGEGGQPVFAVGYDFCLAAFLFLFLFFDVRSSQVRGIGEGSVGP